MQRNGWSKNTGLDKILEMNKLALLTLLAGMSLAWGQIDDFNDGNSDGWTRSDVLAQVGGMPSKITFPDGNRIRLESFPSPDPEALGPSRVGLFLEDVMYTDVTVVMDMVAWDPNLEQDFGIIARGQNVGLGTTSGYVLTLDVDEAAIYLSRLDNEAAATLAKVELIMDVGKTYRFRLSAIGNKISAGVSEADAPGEELVILEAEEEDGYTEGVNGFFTNSGVADGSTDATFDRFIAFDPSGPAARPQIAAYTRFENSVMIDYGVPIQSGGAYVLESSTDLQEWSILEHGSVPLGLTQGSFTASDETVQTRFYRVSEAPPLFTEDFEKGAEGWTTTITTGETAWELGTPGAPDLMEAHSGTQAYGTLLDQPFTDSAITVLWSPVIDLAGKRRPTISFWHYIDVTEGEEGVQLNYLNEAGDAIGSADDIFWVRTDGWTRYEADLPEETLDQKITIEWIFRSDGNSPNGAGFFLDDVVVD